jgi:hypothetical protein
MPNQVRLADLRRPPTSDHQDLRAWVFRDKWLHNDTATVLAWPDDRGCVLHEHTCSHAPKTEEPSAKGRMDEARQLFALEQPKGRNRYFGFCGHCLVERSPNYGRKPTPRELDLVRNMVERLNDVRVLDESPISGAELLNRMRRYGSGDVTTHELKRLLSYYSQVRGDEEHDLSDFVVLKRGR